MNINNDKIETGEDLTITETKNSTRAKVEFPWVLGGICFLSSPKLELTGA